MNALSPQPPDEINGDHPYDRPLWTSKAHLQAIVIHCSISFRTATLYRQHSDFTYLTISVEHRPQITPFHLARSCAAASIFLQLYLHPVVHISFPRSLLQVFVGLPLPLRPCGARCNTCFAMLSSLLQSVSKPVPFSSS